MDSHALHAHLILYQTLIQYSGLSPMYHFGLISYSKTGTPIALPGVYQRQQDGKDAEPPVCQVQTEGCGKVG